VSLRVELESQLGDPEPAGGLDLHKQVLSA
jgi:hypothetical protein